jgi:hypothetical protein
MSMAPVTHQVVRRVLLKLAGDDDGVSRWLHRLLYPAGRGGGLTRECWGEGPQQLVEHYPGAVVVVDAQVAGRESSRSPMRRAVANGSARPKRVDMRAW